MERETPDFETTSTDGRRQGTPLRGILKPSIINRRSSRKPLLHEDLDKVNAAPQPRRAGLTRPDQNSDACINDEGLPSYDEYKSRNHKLPFHHTCQFDLHNNGHDPSQLHRTGVSQCAAWRNATILEEIVMRDNPRMRRHALGFPILVGHDGIPWHYSNRDIGDGSS